MVGERSESSEDLTESCCALAASFVPPIPNLPVDPVSSRDGSCPAGLGSAGKLLDAKLRESRTHQNGQKPCRLRSGAAPPSARSFPHDLKLNFSALGSLRVAFPNVKVSSGSPLAAFILWDEVSCRVRCRIVVNRILSSSHPHHLFLYRVSFAGYYYLWEHNQGLHAPPRLRIRPVSWWSTVGKRQED